MITPYVLAAAAVGAGSLLALFIGVNSIKEWSRLRRRASFFNRAIVDWSNAGCWSTAEHCRSEYKAALRQSWIAISPAIAIIIASIAIGITLQ